MVNSTCNTKGDVSLTLPCLLVPVTRQLILSVARQYTLSSKGSSQDLTNVLHLVSHNLVKVSYPQARKVVVFSQVMSSIPAPFFSSVPISSTLVPEARSYRRTGGTPLVPAVPTASRPRSLAATHQTRSSTQVLCTGTGSRASLSGSSWIFHTKMFLSRDPVTITAPLAVTSTAVISPPWQYLKQLTTLNPTCWMLRNYSCFVTFLQRGTLLNADSSHRGTYPFPLTPPSPRSPRTWTRHLSDPSTPWRLSWQPHPGVA